APPPHVAAPPAAGEVPPDAQAQINGVRRSPANNTRKLLAALAPLMDLGLSEQEAIARGFGRFPVGGYATFSHDWLFPRFTPSFHLHEGTDIFATRGTPVRAPAAGTLKLAQGGSGGLAVYIYEPNGTYYYMAHLDSFAPDLVQGQPVALGQVVGTVGDSGNAKGGAPHVHFEIHPAPSRTVITGKGKNRTVTTVPRSVPVGTVLPPIDPKAHLDQWLRDALADVSRVIASVEARPRALQATGLTRRLGTGTAGGFPGPVSPSRDQLLWVSSASPSGGALRLAEAEAMMAANDFDWSLAARRRQARLEELAEAQARVEALLRPLTPSALQSLPAVPD
ncbi:MAG: M23 family metallopeptidase, partial [Actinomycetota bacterium]|nr:M23 family metallopeptidase [Actinomycetota bacterium]